IHYQVIHLPAPFNYFLLFLSKRKIIKAQRIKYSSGQIDYCINVFIEPCFVIKFVLQTFLYVFKILFKIFLSQRYKNLQDIFFIESKTIQFQTIPCFIWFTLFSNQVSFYFFEQLSNNKHVIGRINGCLVI